MTDLALPVPVRLARVPSALRWLALGLLLAGIAAPDCCLVGSHAFGRGMDTFGAICRARG